MSFIDNFKRIASKMNLRREYLHGDRGKLEGLRQDLKQWNPKNVFGKTGRAAGLGAIDLSWFLFCLGKFGLNDIFLDNYLINKWEQEKRNIQTKNKDSAFESFFKELQKSHPLAASRLQLWMVYALFTTMIVGGVKIVQNNENSNGVKTELNEKKKLSINDIKIDPNLSQEEWNKQMESIWPYLYMETLLSEGFINEAYADVGDSNGYLTIGSGYMIGKANPKTDYDREIIKERKAFFKNALGRHYVNGVKISYEENKILVHKFYKLYVWPQMKKDFSVPMDAHLFIELCIGSYNRGNGIYRRAGNGIRQSVNSGDSIKTIVNHFDDLYETGNNGLFPKYGVAAHRALGNISDTDVLNSVANSVYQFFADDLWQNGELKPYENIAQDLQNFSNLTVKKNGKTYNQYAVREYMLPEEIEIITKGLLFDSTALFSKQVKEQQESTAEQLNEQAEALLDAGDYAGALEKFKLALSQDPKMYILYSNLSLTYYKLGEYDKGINVVKDFICSKYFEFAPASIKGYSYYNAALCYEKLGDKISGVKQKQEYYNRAKKNAELGEKVANTKYYVFNKRIENKLSKLLTLKSKASAFNDGISKLKNKQNIVIYPADKEYLA